MKYTFQSLALASVASARVLQKRQSSCCFGIDVAGDGVEGGSLGQIGDGQNRFGPGQSGATYCINNGQITDKNGRGCVVTGPTHQFQCDQGASPTGGFSVSSSGEVEFNGDGSFYACPVDDEGNYNIYTQPVDNMPKCVKVGLTSADGTCAAPSSAAASSPAASATTAVSVSTATPATSLSVSTEHCEASTVVKTVTQQNNVTVPVTHYETQYQTQTQEHTDTAYQTQTSVQQVPTTIYQTQTQYRTINETQTVPTTVYKTQEETTTVVRTEEITSTAVRTEEETQTQTQIQTQPPVTEEVTQRTTVEQPTTIEQPTTVRQSVTETTSVEQPPVTQSVTEQVTTSVAKPTTVEQPTTISPSPVTETKTSSVQQPSATPSGTGNCPRDLPNMDSYLKPRLIIPVDSNSPDTAYGTQYNAYIGNGNSTIFDFDIPQSYKGKQCEVIFTYPAQSQLETSFVSESGNGGIQFKQLKEAADEKTTFNNQPGVAKDFGEKGVSTGNAYSITTGDCAVGQTISYELTATGDKQVSFFQDWNPCPIGLWVVAN